MAENAALGAATEDEAFYRAQIDDYLAEMKRIQAEMAADQVRTDSLKVETEMLASETRRRLENIWATIARIEAL